MGSSDGKTPGSQRLSAIGLKIYAGDVDERALPFPLTARQRIQYIQVQVRQGVENYSITPADVFDVDKPAATKNTSIFSV